MEGRCGPAVDHRGGARGSRRRHRSRHHQLAGRAAAARRQRPARDHRERAGQAADAVDRRPGQARPDPRGRHGQEPAHRHARAHRRRSQAAHGLAGQGQARRARVHAAGDLGVHLEAAQGRRRARPRRQRRRGGDHRARLLHRRATAGDQGRGRAGGLPRRSHPQRADRRRAGVRARPPRPRAVRARLRSRRRHLRRQRARDVRGGARRQGLGGQQPPRRRRLRPRGRRVAGARVRDGARRRPAPGPEGDGAPQAGGRAGEDGAVVDDGDDRHAAVHRRQRGRAAVARARARAGAAGGADRADDPLDARAGRERAARRQARQVAHHRRGARRRQLAHPAGAGAARRLLRQGGAPRRASRRGHRARRGGAGRAQVGGDLDRARHHDHRRLPVHARGRGGREHRLPENGRHVLADHPAQFDGAGVAHRGLLDDGGPAAHRRHQGLPGRVAADQEQHVPRLVLHRRHPAGAGGAREGGDHLHLRRQRHPQLQDQDRVDGQGGDAGRRQVGAAHVRGRQGQGQGAARRRVARRQGGGGGGHAGGGAGRHAGGGGEGGAGGDGRLASPSGTDEAIVVAARAKLGSVDGANKASSWRSSSPNSRAPATRPAARASIAS